MIVYGDRPLVRAPAALVEALTDGLDALARAAPGLERHAALVALLVAGGELTQGLADRAFDEAGCDGREPAAEAAMALTLALARRVWRSHAAGYAGAGAAREARAALARLRRAHLPDSVTIKSPEGFRHYAVYPEAYAAAAAAALGRRARPLVVGMRTIGTTLAAMVAAALDLREAPLTVRPVGPPFERRLALADEAVRALAAAGRRGVAVVDEGPGLSGSSFGAVLDAARAAGVSEVRTHVFPAHLHLGARATARTRARWDHLARHARPFETLFLGRGPRGLRGWTEPLTGPQRGQPQDVSAGRWRALVFPDPDRWPPVCASRERRKYLLHARAGTFVARFAGVGAAGDAAHARARKLAAEGLTPPVLGCRHGFLVQPWLAEARPLVEASVPRRRLVEAVGAYLAFRARALPATRDRAAPPRALLELAKTNAGEALGAREADRLGRFDAWLGALARDARPVEIDGRCHAWEWLVLPDGRVLKADAIDHCDGHDPVGCQDVAWDVAGAAVELDLAGDEVAALCRRLAVAPEPFAFYRAAYLGFQLGLHHAGAAEADAIEARRLARAAERYARLLAGTP